MDVTDPRERHDDLLVERRERELDAETFAEVAASEAVRAGWVAGALVLDDDERVLLVYHGDDDQWVTPGGAVKPGETLQEALGREVSEETGIEVEPQRPHYLLEETLRCGEEMSGLRFVLFSAKPETTAIGDDLGVDGEPIEDAAWFDELPPATYERERTADVLRRVRNDGD